MKKIHDNQQNNLKRVKNGEGQYGD